jgi:GNAT superfamily N-acetyltransferase
MHELPLLIRKATDDDLNRIHEWLVEQDHNKVDGTFLFNWAMTQKVQRKNQLFVALLEGKPIAYIWEDFGILEVCEEFRGRGVGRCLVGFALTQAQNQERYAINIQCAPVSSIPFWQKIGFELYSTDKASMILPKKLAQPKGGELVKVEFSFYPEKAQWDSSIAEIKYFSANAKRDGNGIIHLSERIAAYCNREQYRGDAVIKICLDDEQIYFGKAKHKKAKQLGVIFKSGAFAVEKIQL